ncbi:MAG TPA: response regulator transcription factor [Candidatus Dormibacteraeota bacterium]|nr:response regulator transcription factor [Candidatus Dormibacteraeota bacterium]
MIRVAIADDQELVRSGVRLILEGEADMQVVGEARSGQEAAELVKRERPDVLLLDIRMPGEDGIAAAGRILAEGVPTRVLILTTFDLDEYVYGALRVGASGFLLKDMAGEDIVAAVRQAARGADSLLAPAVTRRLIERFAGSQPAVRVSSTALRDLTNREVEVLRLVARGLTNAKIAARLSIAETTVKTHVARLLMKLDLRDRVQAVIYAYEAGLVATGSESGVPSPGAESR